MKTKTYIVSISAITAIICVGRFAMALVECDGCLDSKPGCGNLIATDHPTQEYAKNLAQGCSAIPYYNPAYHYTRDTTIQNFDHGFKYYYQSWVQDTCTSDPITRPPDLTNTCTAP